MVDPAQGLYMPEGHDQLRDDYMTRREMLTIARSMTKAHNRALLIIGFYCGARKGELWQAVPHDTFLQLPSNTTKTDKPRIVPVPPKAQRWLRYLPPRVTYHGFGKNYQRARARVGLESVRFNDSRHGAATAMVNAGESLYIVGKILGHTDTRTTERYAQAELGPMAAAVARIGRKRA
jgi:integrase